MNHSKLKGFLYGLATSVTFGLIPLFTLPLMGKGLTSDSILFYRFIAATLALGLMMVMKKESFRIQWKDIPLLVVMGLFYTASSMFLLYGYEVMGAGVATTLHFTYPRAGFMGHLAGHPAGCRRCGAAVYAGNRVEARPVGRVHRAAVRRGLCQLHRVRQ